MDDKKCKICGSNDIKNVYDLKDYFYTKEKFSIKQCLKCDFYFTGGIKSIETIGDYYKTDRYLSHSKNTKTVLSYIYNLVKRYSISRKFLLINKESKGNKILEIGCATGDLLNLFNKAKWQVTGVEPDKDAREYAKSTYNLNVFNTLEDVLDNDFDVIMLWHVLEHIDNFVDIISILKTKLKPNGKIIIALPNPDSWDAKYYKNYWAGWDVPRHLYHFKTKNIKEVLNNKGLDLYKTLPLPFDSFYISLLSEEHKETKNILLKYLKAIFIGLWSNINAINTGNYSSLIYIVKLK